MNKIKVCTVRAGLLGALLTFCSGVFATGQNTDSPPEGAADFREPSAAVTNLLTAPTPPEPMLHAGSSRIALLFR